jgi:hypothetical protein
MNLLRIFIIATILLLSQTDLFASVRRYCKVKYQTEYGWSKEYTLEVEFATGQELNYRTNSFRYSSWSNYVLIWFQNGGVAIIKLSSYLSVVGGKFEREDFLNTFSFRSEVDGYQINDEDQTRWQIRAREYMSFIDPRENQ